MAESNLYDQAAAVRRQISVACYQLVKADGLHRYPVEPFDRFVNAYNNSKDIPLNLSDTDPGIHVALVSEALVYALNVFRGATEKASTGVTLNGAKYHLNGVAKVAAAAGLIDKGRLEELKAFVQKSAKMSSQDRADKIRREQYDLTQYEPEYWTDRELDTNHPVFVAATTARRDIAFARCAVLEADGITVAAPPFDRFQNAHQNVASLQDSSEIAPDSSIYYTLLKEHLDYAFKVYEKALQKATGPYNVELKGGRYHLWGVATVAQRAGVISKLELAECIKFLRVSTYTPRSQKATLRQLAEIQATDGPLQGPVISR